MRSTLHIKFIALYIIFGFLCLFSTATLTEQLVTDKLTEDTSHTLYREATFVANGISPSYFSGDSSIYNVQSQLSRNETVLQRFYLVRRQYRKNTYLFQFRRHCMS